MASASTNVRRSHCSKITRAESGGTVRASDTLRRTGSVFSISSASAAPLSSSNTSNGTWPSPKRRTTTIRGQGRGGRIWKPRVTQAADVGGEMREVLGLGLALDAAPGGRRPHPSQGSLPQA